MILDDDAAAAWRAAIKDQLHVARNLSANWLLPEKKVLLATIVFT
jgi:hypothetical protein